MPATCAAPTRSAEPSRTATVLFVVLLTATGLAACNSGSGGRPGSAPVPSTTPSTTASATAPSPAASVPVPADLAARPCQGATPPATYAHVVVVMMENRTWGQVGGIGFGAMPYLANLAKQCATYADWTQTNPAQSSLTQYIGITSGVSNPRTVDDCSPSARCSSDDDNIFRQVRVAVGTARSFVEGATRPCSAAGNAAKHVPALYYQGTYHDDTGLHADPDFCTSEVRPATELDPDNLPTFALVTPTLCNDGHDCPNSTVDGWARSHLAAILSGRSYGEGRTAVFVVWDESRPVPNLVIAPSATAGPHATPASHADLLRTVEEMLGLPAMAQGQLPTAVSLRPTAPV